MTELLLEAPGHYRLVGSVALSEDVSGILRHPLAAQNGVVVLDLAALGSSDSLMVAILVEWARRIRDMHATLKVVNVPPRLGDLIRVSGLAQLFLS